MKIKYISPRLEIISNPTIVFVSQYTFASFEEFFYEGTFTKDRGNCGPEFTTVEIETNKITSDSNDPSKGTLDVMEFVIVDHETGAFVGTNVLPFSWGETSECLEENADVNISGFINSNELSFSGTIQINSLVANQGQETECNNLIAFINGLDGFPCQFNISFSGTRVSE